MIILCYLLTILYVLAILGLCGVLKNKNIISEEGSRKIVHILVSFAYVFMYKMICTSIHLIIIPCLFVILNYISYKKNLFKGMELDSRKSLGTVYYPLSMVVMATITYFNHSFYPYYGIGLFTMAFADGIAPLIAQKIKSKKIIFDNRTISGSITVFIISLIVLMIFKNIFSISYSFIEIILLAVISTVLEFFGGKIDNLVLPIGISLLSYMVVMI